MSFKLISLVCYFILYSLVSVDRLQAQILRDSTSLKLVKETVNDIYSMRFGDAGATISRINNMYPEHPVVLLLNGMSIYWENYPLLETSPAREEFEKQLHNCISKCENYKKEDEAEYLLVNLCARGILLLFYSYNDLNSKIFTLGKSTYRYIRRSFDFTSTFYDFYFFTGLYNYYREVYPDFHPLFKSVFLLFPRGDRKRGLKEIQTAFQKSIFMRAEASYFLSSNYKYFETDFMKASYFSRTLFNYYPSNMEFRANCIEDLLLSGKYDEAENLIMSPGLKINNKYYQAEFTIFRGILSEKKYHNMKIAEQEYLSGAKDILPFYDYGYQYAAYAYFGLSRISALNNDRHNQRLYRRKALDLTDFKSVNFDK